MQASEIPGFKTELVSKAIRANYFILQNVYSELANINIKKRFGKALSEDIATDAVTQINSCVLSAMIKKLLVAAANTGTVTFDAAPDAGISVVEHRRTFTDVLEAAGEKMADATDRGAISFIIAGSYGRRILRSIGTSLSRKSLPGPLARIVALRSNVY